MRDCPSAVPKGQFEAAAAVRLKFRGALRHVVLPAAKRFSSELATQYLPLRKVFAVGIGRCFSG